MGWKINSWGVPTLDTLESQSLTGLGYALVYLALFILLFIFLLVAFASVARTAIWLRHAWKGRHSTTGAVSGDADVGPEFIPLRDAAERAFDPEIMGDRSGVGTETRIREQITIMRLDALHHPERLGIYGCVPPSNKITRVPQKHLEGLSFALDGSAIGPNLIDEPDRVDWSPLYVRHDELKRHMARLSRGDTFGQKPVSPKYSRDKTEGLRAAVKAMEALCLSGQGTAGSAEAFSVFNSIARDFESAPELIEHLLEIDRKTALVLITRDAQHDPKQIDIDFGELTQAMRDVSAATKAVLDATNWVIYEND